MPNVYTADYYYYYYYYYYLLHYIQQNPSGDANTPSATGLAIMFAGNRH
jgi:hypothetical protein